MSNGNQKEKKILLYPVVLSIILLVIWFIIQFHFGFAGYHVEGPGNEFLPIFRFPLLMLILLYPFFNYLILVNIKIFEGIIDTPILREPFTKFTSLKIVFWTILWPGLYLILGWYLNIIPSVFDPAITTPHKLTVLYWSLFLLIGRLLDPIFYLIIKIPVIMPTTPSNAIRFFSYYVRRIIFDISIVFFACMLQFFAFFVPMAIGAPFVLLSEFIPGIFALFGLTFLIGWPIFSLLGFLVALFLRTTLQYWGFKETTQLIEKLDSRIRSVEFSIQQRFYGSRWNPWLKRKILKNE